MDYREKQYALKMEKVSVRLKEKMSHITMGIKYTPVLKLRIADCDEPLERSNKSVAILSIYNPAEDILDELKEKSSFLIFNLNARGTRSNEKQLSTTNLTHFKKASNTSHINISRFERHCTNIAEMVQSKFEPLFNEIDTVGLIVCIDDINAQNFQSVYLADEKHNMICINFWNGLATFAYDNLIEIGKILAVNNLRKRMATKLATKIPIFFATELSTFTIYPKSMDTQHIQKFFINNFTDLNTKNHYISECMQIINKFKTESNCMRRSNSTPSPINNRKLLEFASAEVLAAIPSPPEYVMKFGPVLVSPLIRKKIKMSK